MEIIYLKNVDSTHTYLKNYIKTNGYTKPLAIVTQNQTNGIGSRDNSWKGMNGNLFFSFVLHKDLLPNDLPLQSASIYFSFLLKIILEQFGSKIWLKWPNDFYNVDKKIGGTITNVSGDLMLCGIGLNLVKVDEKFGYLDINIDHEKVLKEYFLLLAKPLSWKMVFSKFKIEFHKNNKFTTNINGKKITLDKSQLLDDGSLLIDGEKAYSLR
ncbi:MAG: biotin--[acetyl-CoA-carboxylase] ligase [Campylobacterales bacterium]|nr:biotin--[acetyl-CoA-carboxylase] ligase [Campylobacterales bacterium]